MNEETPLFRGLRIQERIAGEAGIESVRAGVNSQIMIYS